jgi:hypothetical protein
LVFAIKLKYREDFGKATSHNFNFCPNVTQRNLRNLQRPRIRPYIIFVPKNLQAYGTKCSALQVGASAVLKLHIAGDEQGAGAASNGIMFTPRLVKISNWFKI